MANVGVENTPEIRGQYRQLLFQTKNLSSNLGGVILEKETLHQKDASGARIADTLINAGIKIGVKADKGMVTISKKMFYGFSYSSNAINFWRQISIQNSLKFIIKPKIIKGLLDVR